MKKTTKILAFALALMMLFTSIPLLAFPASAESKAPAARATGDIVTDYGTIPAASASGKQAALFVKSGDAENYTLIGTYTSFYIDGKSADAAMDVAYATYLKQENNDVVIYLLDDVTTTKSCFKDPDGYSGNTFTLDLGGYTFTTSVQIAYFQTNQGASGHDKFIFKNGSIKYTKYVIWLRYMSGGKGTGADFTFENITFIDNNTTTASASSYIVNAQDISVPSQTLTTNLTFTNCKVEAASGVTLRNNYLSLSDYTTSTGKQVAGADTPDDTSDDVYEKITVSCDHSTKKEDGFCRICGEYAEAPSEDDIVTSYGTIPGAYSNKTDYPIAVFTNNGSGWEYAKSFKDWRSGNGKCTDGNAVDAVGLAYYYLWKIGTADVAIYLLDNVDLTGKSAGFPDADAFNGRKLIIDLNENTLTIPENLFYFQTNGNTAGKEDFTVKNGTLKYSNRVAQFITKDGSTSSGCNFTFENINFIDVKKTEIIRGVLTTPNTADPIIECNITFKNCTVETELNRLIFNGSDYMVEGGKNKIYVSVDCDHNAVTAEGICPICGEDLNPQIANVSVTISSDLALNYYTNIKGIYKDVYTLKIGDLILTGYESDGVVVFTYDGIGPHQIGNEVTAELYREEELCDSKTYSVMQYLHDLYAIEAAKTNLDKKGETKRDNTIYLICALLTYGQEAEKYRKNGVTSITLPEGMTKNHYMGYAPGEDWYGTDDQLTLNKKGDADLYIKSAGIRFDTINKIYFKIYAKEAPTVTIDGKTVSLTEADKDGDFYVIYTDGIAPTAYYDAVTLTLSNGESVTYSITAYTCHMSADEDIGALVNALYNFGICCMDYAESLEA